MTYVVNSSLNIMLLTTATSFPTEKKQQQTKKLTFAKKVLFGEDVTFWGEMCFFWERGEKCTKMS